MQKPLLILLVVVVVVGGLSVYFVKGNPPNSQQLKDQIAEKADLIKVEKPKFNEAIESPYTVAGQARGMWYFEATFPVKLIDSNGNILAETYAQAKSDWMTTEFVPFESELVFEKPSTKTGALILQKDNPSGLPENADEIAIPVRFK